MANVIFMGTPKFAVPSLIALDETQDVVGVVTQPDRPAGRGRDLRLSPIKQEALKRDRPLFQPQSLRTPEAQARLRAWQPDVIVVTAFGQILTPDVLELAPHGCLNVHASLLPRWRGAAPVAAAILAGDEITGVTVMKMDAGLDTGPIVAQREEPIRSDDTRAALGKRLSQLGAELLAETLPGYLAGEITPRPQREEEATYADQLRKEDGRLDWTEPAVALERRMRAFTPWPGTFTTWQGRRLKILQAEPLPERRSEAEPGMVIDLDEGCGVVTGEGVLRLEKVQLAGKRAMVIDVFLPGQRDFIGGQLGK
jgi:methionyl-tRNA formyltransferase